MPNSFQVWITADPPHGPVPREYNSKSVWLYPHHAPSRFFRLYDSGSLNTFL